MKISPNRQKKEAAVSSLSEALGRGKAVVLTDYRGLNMHKLSQLRTKLAEANATINVVKNTLLSRALKLSNYPQPQDHVLKGPTALVTAYGDEITPVKTLALFARLHQLPTFKAGYLGLTYLPAQKLQELALLPNHDELIGQTIGMISMPLKGIVNVLQANVRNLVYVLREVQKGGGLYGRRPKKS